MSYTGNTDGKKGNLEVNFENDVKFNVGVNISVPKKVSYDFSFDGNGIVAQSRSKNNAISVFGLKIDEMKFSGDSLTVKTIMGRKEIWQKDKK